MFTKRVFLLQVRKPSVIAPFTVFQSTGMVMARPVPVQLSPDNESQIAREGYVALTAIPRSDSGFEKEKRITVKLRAKQIGQLIAWRGLVPNGVSNQRSGFSSSLNITAYAGSIPVSVDVKPSTAGDDSEPMLQLTLTPKSGETLLPVSVPISVGEMKAFQVLLESCLPNLYGWTWKSTAPMKSLSSTITAKSPEDFFKQFSASG
jgi:hypothetical protein